MESLTKVVGRCFKRMIGEPVGLEDYDEIWAEIKKDGGVVHGSISDMPSLKLVAVRAGDDDWTVIQEESIIWDAGYPFVLGCTSDFCDVGAPQTTKVYLRRIGEPQSMKTAEVIELMKASDPEPRRVSGHYTRALALA